MQGLGFGVFGFLGYGFLGYGRIDFQISVWIFPSNHPRMPRLIDLESRATRGSCCNAKAVYSRLLVRS